MSAPEYRSLFPIRGADGATVLVSLVACALVVIAPDDAVRAIGGLPLALFLPGYAAARWRRSQSVPEYLALSVGLSVVAGILCGLLLVSVGAFSTRSIALLLAGLTVALVVAPAKLDPQPALGRVRRAVLDRSAVAAGIVVILILGGAVAWSVQSQHASAAKATTSAVSAYQSGDTLVMAVSLIPADRAGASVQVTSGKTLLFAYPIASGQSQWKASAPFPGGRRRVTLYLHGRVVSTLLLLPAPAPSAAAAPAR
jgi:hypothetical protein